MDYQAADMNTDIDSDRARSLIRQEEIRLLHAGMPVSAVATVAISLISYFALVDHAVSQVNLVIWISLMLIIIGMRTWDTFAYSRSSTEEQNKPYWGPRFLLGSASAGTCWGLLAWLGFSTINEYQGLIAVIIVGVCGGATATLSYRWQSIALFMTPALGLLELRMLMETSEFSQNIAYLLGIFIFFAVLTSRRIYINTNSNVKLRIEALLREETLFQIKEDAERANHAKSDFLSSMSHELRTPISAIIGFAQLMQNDSNLKERQQKLINEISSAGGHLLNLVNQLLDLATIEKGTKSLEIQAIDVRAILDECLTLASPLATRHRVEILIDQECSAEVIADNTAIKQIFLNLITNAIKYNHEGGRVNIHCTRTTDERLRFSVSDTGKGLTKEQTEYIFQPFNRLSDSTKLIEGSGIGLNISKDLIEKMDGRIGVDSEPGQGSTFWFEIKGTLTPTEASPNPDGTATHQTIQTDAVVADATILVAEDNATNQLLLKSQLEAIGYRADIVNNGAEALERIRGRKYQLILTDCNMPEMDGYQLTRRLRSDGYSTPVIGITADAFPESEEKCRDAGINARLVKPVDLEELQSMIQKHISPPA